MSRGINVCAIVLLVLFELATSAMVLPRPPSSPNHIRQDQELSARKALEGKSLHGASRDTNVEKPDTEDYRLLEIELQSTDEMDAANLQGLVRAMLKQQQQQQTEQLMPNDSYPNPEVVPHSIVGVRDMGLSPNYRLDTFDDDKRVLLSPPKVQSLDEKLYYLKSGRPKVYVNVRGHSGSFRKATVSPTATPSEGALGYLKVTRPFERQTDWKARDKKARPPKKFDRRVDFQRNEMVGRVSDQATSYGTDDPSTTENSMVTSSELPKQIPAPPSKVRGRILMAQTTPVQRYALRRTDILPGYGFSEE
ncbi:hypothetical protein DMN91_003360 [Ooceraea biroi]|uniref:Uncharacterized protein n=1 Tax=Ooceraea biroi TaxID=2015173 RepID=A0A026WNR7_OOCBI|nr:uncharacterized protein LOC105276894 [Ooceraea biroi]EZA57697.1 hypothetical protein X777_00797 [Ooceraea biroi]RLU25267.1 hypothetical protein DMN91_003360 [Ooceraea biroi]